VQKKSEGLYYKVFSFLFLSAIFFFLRLDTFKYVYDSVVIKLIDPDSYYHLRRILYTINNYPKMLNFDNFLSYPLGDYVPWPPLFDFISATLAIILKNINFVLPALDMFYFFLGFSIIYFCLQKEFGFIPAVTTAFFLATTGILRVYSSFGRLDHHALELLIITACYASFCAYYKNKDIFFLLLLTATILAAFFNWPGSVIYFPPMVVFVFYKLYRKDADPQIFKGLFVAFHITAILIAIYLRFTKTTDYPPYSFKFFSGFQRDFCFFISIVFFNIYLAMKTKINRVLIGTTAVVILFVVFHKFIFELFSGFSFVGKTTSVFALIEESASLFFSPFYSRKEELERALSLFSPFFFIFPFIFYRYAKEKGVDLIFIYTAYFLILTFFQLRFGYFFMLGYAVMLGITVAHLLELLKRHVIFFIMAIITLFLFYSNYKDAPKRFENQSLYEALHFLKEKTPMKDEFMLGKTPYGVMASWHLGHYIIELGNRPAVTHNFIGVSKNYDPKAFITALFSKTEQEVVQIMKEKNAKFLFLDDIKSLIFTDWSAISDTPNPYTKSKYELNDNVYQLFLYRLYHFNGVTPPFNQTTKNFRLVFEKGDIKIFELVEGYKIDVQDDVILKAKIATPDKIFFFISEGQSNKNGKTFTIPYTLDSPYPVKALEIYLEKDGEKMPITVTEGMLH